MQRGYHQNDIRETSVFIMNILIKILQGHRYSNQRFKICS